MNPQIDEIINEVTKREINAYYDIHTKTYLVEDSRGIWIPHNEGQMKRYLKMMGYSTHQPEPGMLSPCDAELVRIMHEKGVEYVGPYAGYKKGYYETDVMRILVTSSPIIIEPKDIPFPTILALIQGLLASEIQINTFFAWIKLAYATLKAGKHRDAQALAFIGPRGAGKSVLQNLITLILGGRSARPYQFMTGKTQFNSDLFKGEHQMIEDESPSTDIQARRAFGSQLKLMTVVKNQRIHAKYAEGKTILPVFWRLTMSLNDEPENVMVLPPLDDSIVDKIILFKTEKKGMPMPTTKLEDREKFWNQLVSELPGFLCFIERFEIPPELEDPRFGVKEYHNPVILGLLNDMSSELSLLDLIDEFYYPSNKPAGECKEHELTAKEIANALTSHVSPVSHEARKLLSWTNACGTLLGRIAKKFPDRVKKHKKPDSRRWMIYPPGNNPKK